MTETRSSGARAKREEKTGGQATELCCVRLPVRDLDRSVAFYTEVFGFRCDHRSGASEAMCRLPVDDGPVVFLMKTNEEQFRHIHWQVGDRFFSAFELEVDDLELVHNRVAAAGGAVQTSPHIDRGEWKAIQIFDPDGHYLFVVDRRGRYFSICETAARALGRSLSKPEREAIARICVDAGESAAAVLQSLLNELV